MGTDLYINAPVVVDAEGWVYGRVQRISDDGSRVHVTRCGRDPGETFPVELVKLDVF